MTRRDMLLAGASSATLSMLKSALSAAPTNGVAVQPLLAQVRRVLQALELLGAPLDPMHARSIVNADSHPERSDVVESVQEALSTRVLLEVTVNPESRVRVNRGPAFPLLVQSGWRVFLVKVRNQAGVTERLHCASPQALPDSGQAPNSQITATGIVPPGSSRPVQSIRSNDVVDRWLSVEMFNRVPLETELSGLPLEYRVIQLYSRDSGLREADLAFNVGPATADIGFRNSVAVVFTCKPARSVQLRIREFDGNAATASLTISDAEGRIYPCRAKRLAPDFPFQKQIYRADGQTVSLPVGSYTLVAERGPEYIPTTLNLVVPDETQRVAQVQLSRWIDPAEHGWFSGDHHVHAAGCAHYNTPSDGVLPSDMAPQVRGEGLSFADILTWGPCWYYQKGFFRAAIDPISDASSTLRYDVEVSGFPSSYWGHLVLLQLRKQDFPGASEIEQWPTWNLPILDWAKSQGAVTGYAHTGHGLSVATTQVPNSLIPPFNDNGANEFLIDVTYGVVDFLSAVDTPAPAELNLWYHVLNCGFQIPIAGETDFPCLFEKVGVGRTYVHLSTPPVGEAGYRAWITGLKSGRSYVSDGRSHILTMTVNEMSFEQGPRELSFSHSSSLTVSARVAAYLPSTTSNETKSIRASSLEEAPYWHIERARIQSSRYVRVELIVNGDCVAFKDVLADGTPHSVTFRTEIRESSWLALRVFPSSHSNPIFVKIGGTPIRASRKSAHWCTDCIQAAWGRLGGRIATHDQSRARQAMEHALKTFRSILAETV